MMLNVGWDQLVILYQLLQSKSCVVSSNYIKVEGVTYCYNFLRNLGPLNQLFRGVTHRSTSQYRYLIGGTLPSLSKWIRCKTKHQKACQFRCFCRACEIHCNMCMNNPDSARQEHVLLLLHKMHLKWHIQQLQY